MGRMVRIQRRKRAVGLGAGDQRLCGYSLRSGCGDAGLDRGRVDGNAGQIANQAIGAGVAWVLAIVGTLVILKLCDALIGLRVEKDDEIQGLDLSMHGEEGYILES